MVLHSWRTLAFCLGTHIAGFPAASAQDVFLPAAAPRQLGTAANDTEAQESYPDHEPANCDLGQNCTDGGIPVYRGLCVMATNPGTGRACWDVCNVKHAPQSYKMNNNHAVSMSYAGMVESVRAGLNPMVKCPGVVVGDPCPPGDPCTYEMRKEFDIPVGRGMCVIDSKRPNGRACWDMCNTRRSPSAFTIGTPAGTAAHIAAVRGSQSVCPGTPWWQWLLVLLVVLLVLLCVAGVGYVVKTRGGKRSRSRGMPLDQARYAEQGAPDFKQDYSEPLRDPLAQGGMEPMVPQQDVSPQNEYMQEDYQNSGRYQDTRFQEPAHELPPEPPRAGSMTATAERAAPPLDMMSSPAQTPMMPPAPAAAIPQEPIQQQSQDLGPFYPGGTPGGSMPAPVDLTMVSGGLSASALSPCAGSVRIPGLDEPNLFLAPGVQPQGTFLGATQAANPQVIQSSFMMGGAAGAAQPQAAMPSFHTQIPSNYMVGASPPASVQIRPAVAGGQQFFTQLQRR